MDDVKRGPSSSSMRVFTCKDCQRAVDALQRELERLRGSGANRRAVDKVRRELANRKTQATYNERWAQNLIERGGSRSDRCREHREKHRTNIQGIAVAYIDLRTVGEVLDRQNPTGPLGGLGPLPTAHTFVPNTSYPLQDVSVGMTDADIVEMIALLRKKRVLILKAGTGTGKSTFAPYRLMDPPPASLVDVPPGSPFVKLSELGQIVVTEPRVQAAIGVAEFVGGVMSGAGGVGPGFPVGYQVSGDRNHDAACELVYVTDGTMINWLREGRLSQIGTVIVDEAHERSTNIDFIMGYLKRELGRYPHLRVIVTSATFNTDFYQQYFGGPEVAAVKDVEAVKGFGYGMPLFPNLDAPEKGEDDVLTRWSYPDLPLSADAENRRAFIKRHWKERYAPPLTEREVVDPADIGDVEDVWTTTLTLLDLRFTGCIAPELWRDRMPEALASFVVDLARGLDEAGIFGDILAFLPTTKTIEAACDDVGRALGRRYAGHVFPLISTLPKDRQLMALAPRRKGDPRKIVISTNLAETSLTVEGVRFVVDSGLIAQSEWDPGLAKGSIQTKLHSRAGVRQRWGRVGRKAPGWVFPLYTKGQFLALDEDTPPGSTRENLEALVMTAKMGGIDDVVDFPWPAASDPVPTTSTKFKRELARAHGALEAGGAVDVDGHPTPFGKEIARFSGLGSAASALAILYADRLACVPEVATILALLEDTRLIGPRGLLLDDFTWPDEWRLEAAERHRGIAGLCEDDAHLVLLIAAAWERADMKANPWEPSERRQRWARQWWVNDEVLRATAARRQEVLAALSPAMKEEVKRFLEPALLDRARGAITRAMAGLGYERRDNSTYLPVLGRTEAIEPETDELSESTEPDAPATTASRGPVPASIEQDSLFPEGADRVIALRRRESRDETRISNLVSVPRWALRESGSVDAPTGVRDSTRLVVDAARFAPPDPRREVALGLMRQWPVGLRIDAELDGGEGTISIVDVVATIDPFPRPMTEIERDERDANSRRRRRKRLADPDVEADATGVDLDVELRAYRKRQGDIDEAEADARAFRASDAMLDTAPSCGVCIACTGGRERDCENVLLDDDSSERADPLAEWRRAAREGVDVASPRVRIDGGAASRRGRFEVSDYDLRGPEPTIVLRPDWRPEGFTGSPATHSGAEPGMPVEVVVGTRVRHHGGPLRVFVRADEKGRFVMKEASTRDAAMQLQRGEIAISLHRGVQGFLAGLIEGTHLMATVVPARVAGCFTITLLELQHQHLEKAGPGRGVQFRVLDTTKRNAAREAVHVATIVEAPNANGYARAALAVQDSVSGIHHHFEFQAIRRPPPPSVEASVPEQGRTTTDPPQAAGSDLQATAPVLLRLVRDSGDLEVGGLDLDALAEIRKESDRHLLLRNEEPKGAGTSMVGGAEGAGDEPQVLRPAGPDAVVRLTGSQPLSRHAAQRLAQLDPSPEWQNEVWSFWARSHHLKVARYLPADHAEVVEVPATVVIEEAAPLDVRRRRVAAFAERHAVHAVVEATVDRITDAYAFVSVTVDTDDGPTDVEARLPRDEVSWRRNAHPSETLTPGQRVHLLVTEVRRDEAIVLVSRRQLEPDPLPAFATKHSVGDIVRVRVKNAIASGVFVALTDGLDGFIHLSELSWNHVVDATAVFATDAVIDTKILHIDQDERRIGLSARQALDHPVERFARSHRPGDDVIGRIRNVSSAGATVALTEDVDGFLTVGEIAWDRVPDASAVLREDQRIRVRILDVDTKGRKVSLSLKRLLPDPFDAFASRYRAGDSVSGSVERFVKDGALVRLAPGMTGYLHVSEVSRNPVPDIERALRLGQTVRAKLKEVDIQGRKVRLSMKALEPPPYDVFVVAHPVGSIVQGTVKTLVEHAAFVTLAAGVDGFLHVSEMAPHRVDRPSDVLHQGDVLRVKIIAIEPEKRRIRISIKQVGISAPVIPTPPPSKPALPPRPKRSLRGTGRSYEEAVAAATAPLGLSPSMVDVTVVEEPRTNLLGRTKGQWAVEVRER